MYFVKIPLRFLSEPERLNVPADQQQAKWDSRVQGLLNDLREGHIPGWATSYEDLDALKIEKEK